MKIGILQTGHGPEPIISKTGDYDIQFARLLDGHGFTFQTWNVVDMDFPTGARDADGWLITGSRHGAYEDHPFIPPLEDLIRAIFKAQKPLIGVCFGHQIIAQALGGKVEKFEGGWAVGRHEYDVGGERVALNAWHQDQVTDLPADARVLGSSDFCANAMLAYGDTVWTVQAHPEFTQEWVSGLLDHRGPGIVPAPLLEQAQSDLAAPVDSQKIGQQMARHFLARKQEPAE